MEAGFSQIQSHILNPINSIDWHAVLSDSGSEIISLYFFSKFFITKINVKCSYSFASLSNVVCIPHCWWYIWHYGSDNHTKIGVINTSQCHICDWASKNWPSRQIKFHHIYHCCCIITIHLFKLLKFKISVIDKQFNMQYFTTYRK